MGAWPSRRMEELCEITSSKRIYRSDYVAEGVPFYRGKEVTEKSRGSLDLTTELFITEEKYGEIERKFGVPSPGDLLLTSVGTLGSVYVVRSGDRFYFKDGNLTWFRHFRDLDSRFLCYWLGSPQGKEQLGKSTIGSSQSAFTIVLLKRMEVELPPLPTQRKIAAILSAYDDLIENNLRRIKILEQMAQAIYREWFVHFRFPGHEHVRMVDSRLGKIPADWDAPFGDLATIARRNINPSEMSDEMFEHFSVPAYDDGRKPVVEAGESIRSGKYRICDECVLLCKLNPRISRVWLPFPSGKYLSIASTEFVVLIPKPGVARFFLFSMCSSAGFAAKL